MATNTTGIFRLVATSVDSADGDANGYIREFVATNQSGIVRIVGSVASTLTAEQNPINDVTITTSGNTFTCNAKGQSGHTDDWTMKLYQGV
jgi:hypothetical protein